ncbi:MAG: hypothetical protein RR588_02070 [Solibacillus sp.]
MAAINTNIKLKKGDILKSTFLKVEPGAGAVDLAQRYYFFNMANRDELEIAEALVDGRFEGVDDPKVRRCAHCGYYYRDKTKNNMSVTCSKECASGKDIVLKSWRREVRKVGKVRRLSWLDLHYASSYQGEPLEYPFWSSDWHMFEYDRKRKVYSFGDDFEQYVAQQKRKAEMGGKRKTAEQIDYDGYNTPRNIYVKLGGSVGYGKETVIKRSREDIEADLLARYGAKKLQQERIRAQMAALGRYKF